MRVVCNEIHNFVTYVLAMTNDYYPYNNYYYYYYSNFLFDFKYSIQYTITGVYFSQVKNKP
jgi:hypothetical protein